MDEDEAPFAHFGDASTMRKKPKFKSPIRRATKLLDQLNKEMMTKIREEKPAVFGEEIRVGDAIEAEVVDCGGLENGMMEKIRGTVIAKNRKGLAASLQVIDHVSGDTLEYTLSLYAPTTKSIKVLERNYIFKGKRKIKRAKILYVRDFHPNREYSYCCSACLCLFCCCCVCVPVGTGLNVLLLFHEMVSLTPMSFLVYA